MSWLGKNKSKDQPKPPQSGSSVNDEIWEMVDKAQDKPTGEIPVGHKSIFSGPPAMSKPSALTNSGGPRPLTESRSQNAATPKSMTLSKPFATSKPEPVAESKRAVIEAPAVKAEIDYERLAEIVVEKLENSSLANKIASKVPLPDNEMSMSEFDMQTLANKIQSLLLETLSVQVMESGKQIAVPITQFVGEMRQQLDRLEQKPTAFITFKWWELLLAVAIIQTMFVGAIAFIIAIAMR